jgi:hypothetical protein
MSSTVYKGRVRVTMRVMTERVRTERERERERERKREHICPRVMKRRVIDFHDSLFKALNINKYA